MNECGRCGKPIDNPNMAFVLYVEPDPESTARIEVHALCIEDEVAERRLVRWSNFSYRVA